MQLNRLSLLFLLSCVTMLSGGCSGNSTADTVTSANTVNPANPVNKIQMGGAIQNSLLSLTNTVTTLAGTSGTTGSTGSADGAGVAARFNYPYGITTDGTNLYVTDTFNRTIRKIEISTGAVTTLAGTAGTVGSADGIGAAAGFSELAGITTDGINLYVTDNSTIRKIVISTGAVTTLAGTAGVAGSADGVGGAAGFHEPAGITTDGINLYVTDYYAIRKIVISTGAVTTLAGTAGVAGSADGIGGAARFYDSEGITTDGTNLYVVDTGNSTIRKIVISTGAVTTLAGLAGSSSTGSDNDGTGSAARFLYPGDITTDGTNLYVTEHRLIPPYSGLGPRAYYGNDIIRKIVPSTGVVTTLAGNAEGISGAADGVGAAASFFCLQGITTDGTSLYLADAYNNTIRKMH